MSIKVLEKETQLVHQAEKTISLGTEQVWLTHCGLGIFDEGVVHAGPDARINCLVCLAAEIIDE